MLSSEYAIKPVDGWSRAHHHLSTCLGAMLLGFAFVIRGSPCSLISIGRDSEWVCSGSSLSLLANGVKTPYSVCVSGYSYLFDCFLQATTYYS